MNGPGLFQYGTQGLFTIKFFHNSCLVRGIQQRNLQKKLRLDPGLNPDRLLSS